MLRVLFCFFPEFVQKLFKKGWVLLDLQRQKASCTRRACPSSSYICCFWGNFEQIDFVKNWVQLW